MLQLQEIHFEGEGEKREGREVLFAGNANMARRADADSTTYRYKVSQ
jgi:hypothetical protein